MSKGDISGGFDARALMSDRTHPPVTGTGPHRTADRTADCFGCRYLESWFPMELLCTVYPVAEDLDTTAQFYLDMGFRDVARPDKDTVLLASGDSPYVEIMLERHPVEAAAGSGPVFRVADVTAFHADNPDLDWRFPPVDLPTGKYALFCDSEGNPVRLADFRNDSGRYARLFRSQTG